MARKREIRPAKKMKHICLVFCEGETEEAYLDFLRNTYQSPIKIVSKVEGADINQRVVDNKAKSLRLSSRDKVKVFLMYDLDVEAVNEKLKGIRAELIGSNPCIELWFLLHREHRRASISSAECLRKLTSKNDCWATYKKSDLSDAQKKYLLTNVSKAIMASKELKDGDNPSCSIYKLIDYLKVNI